MLRTIVILIACFAMPATTEGPVTKSIFLVAKKDLPDPNFRDTVVLVTKGDSPAPMGVIVNRRTEITVAKALPGVKDLKGGDRPMYFGGPVHPQGVVAVFRAAKAPKNSVEVLEGLYLTSSREVLVELLAREHAADELRLFAGHASWAPGQLENEIARGSWHLANADARTIFSRNPERLWQQMERRAASTAASLGAP